MILLLGGIYHHYFEASNKTSPLKGRPLFTTFSDMRVIPLDGSDLGTLRVVRPLTCGRDHEDMVFF